MRTVRATIMLVSLSSGVRLTYIGVFSAWTRLPLDCSRVPTQARKSGFSDPAWLTNSQRPSCMRIAVSAVIDSMTDTMGPI